MKKKLLGFCWDEIAITCLLLTKFPFGTEIRLSQKIMRDGWSGFGMATVGIHPNDFDLDPNKIPTGGVVQNCLPGIHKRDVLQARSAYLPIKHSTDTPC